MEMLKQDPNDSFCLYGVAQEHAKIGDCTEAIAWFERVLTVEPNHAYAHFHLAKALEHAEHIPRAIEILRRGLVVSRASNDTKATNELAGYLDELTP